MKLHFAFVAALLIAPQALSTDFGPSGTWSCLTVQSCEEDVAHAIDTASKSIKVEAYQFTSLPIIRALQRARERKVEVSVIVDRLDQQDAATAKLLGDLGIPVWIDSPPAKAVNTLFIIDGHLTIGSNYDKDAPVKRNNLWSFTFAKGTDLAAKFGVYWESRLALSKKFDEGDRTGQ